MKDIVVRVKTRNLKIFLFRKNWSQNELARRSGVSTAFLAQIMSGIRSPGPKVRAKIMQVLKVKDFDLLFKIERKKT